MRSCRKAQRLLSADIGRLEGRRADALHRHLEACDVCQRRAERLRSLIAALREEPPVAPPDLWPRIQAAAAALAPPYRTRGLRWFDLAVAYSAVAATVLMVGFSVAHHLSTPAQGHSHGQAEQLLADGARVLFGDVALAAGPDLFPEVEEILVAYRPEAGR